METQQVEFINAQEMAKKHPDTFEAPTIEELNSIVKGASVKVCANNAERFWVTVTELDGESVKGIVDNNLVCSDEHGLYYGDEISFFKSNIYSIFY